jgi:putative toxin-antitoxin system antitoxin component (TIGR02293 family)
LRFSAISHLEAAFDASQKEIAVILSIAPTTLTRRKKEGLLHADESDRVVRFARLKDAVLALTYGDDAAAISWLKTPLPILGGDSPLAHASTELGARDVEDLIGRLRHGVFS